MAYTRFREEATNSRYVSIATDHRAKAGSQRTKEIADFDLGPKALKPI